MYRTEEQFKKLNNRKLETPVCILSLSRPNAPIFASLDEFDKDEVFIFIRNTKEQKELYKEYEDKFTITLLPDDVKEAGATRRAIVDWALDNNYENIFVFDDRIKEVNFLSPKTSKSGKLSLAKSPNSTFYQSLLIWEDILKEHPFTMSCPSHKGFSYFPENIDKEYEANNGNVAACISINVFDFEEFDINYKNVNEVGWDDGCIVFDVLHAGLPICKITDLEYDEVPSHLIGSGGTHGDDTISLLERCESRNRLFWENVVKQPVGTQNPGVYLRKQSGGIYPYFKWKYWKEYYQNNKAKEV